MIQLTPMYLISLLRTGMSKKDSFPDMGYLVVAHGSEAGDRVIQSLKKCNFINTHFIHELSFV